MVKDYVIAKRLKELCPNGHLNNAQNLLLLEEYAKDRQNGVSPEDSEARTLLIFGNRKFVYYVIRKRWGVADVENSDEASVGQVGLIKAIDTFRLDADSMFITYAWNVIQNEVGMYYNKLRRKRLMPEQQIFLEDCIKDSIDGAELQILETIADEEDFVENIQDTECVKDIIKNLRYLTYNEAFVVIMNLGLLGNKPLTHENIAKLLNISRPYTTKIFHMGIKKLQVLVIGEQDLGLSDVILKNRLLREGCQNNIVEEMKQQENERNM